MPNYLARSTQRRLLSLVLAVAAVLWLLSWASNPDNFGWVVEWAQRPAPDRSVIDTRLDPENGTPLIIAERPLDNQDRRQSGVGGRRALLGGVDENWFDEVHDDAPLRRDEVPVMAKLFQVLDGMTPAAIDEASSGPVTFVQLYTQPDAYRGELVTVEGVVHGAFPESLPLGEGQQQKVFQVWLRPKDRTDPIVAYCQELPANFPQGFDLKERVTLTGFFFKRMAYRAKDDLEHSVPLLIARDLTWVPAPPPPEPAEDQFARVIPYALGAAVAVTIGVIWLASRKVGRTPRPHAPPPTTPGEFEKLRNLEVAPDVRDALAKLEPDPSRGPDRPPAP